MDNRVQINILLDKSGSMSSCVEQTITSFNNFITEQKAEPNPELVTITLVQFDTQYELNYMCCPLLEVPELNTKNYVPRGGTNLYTSLDRLISETEQVVETTPLNTRPTKVLYLVITDGEDTSGVSNANVKEKVVGYTAQGRVFVFLAQGIDQAKKQEYFTKSVGATKGSVLAVASLADSSTYQKRLSRSVGEYRSVSLECAADASMFWKQDVEEVASDSTATPKK